MIARLLLGATGVVLALVGVAQLLGEEWTRLWSLVLWLAGGVLVHDLVLAPLTVLVVALGARVVPRAARTTAVVGLVVWGTVTLAAANVLLGVGGVPDNPTLLERPYLRWWLVLSALWWIGVGVVGSLAVRRALSASEGRPRDGRPT